MFKKKFNLELKEFYNKMTLYSTEGFCQQTARFLISLDSLWQELQSPPFTLTSTPLDLFCNTDRGAFEYERAGLPGKP